MESFVDVVRLLVSIFYHNYLYIYIVKLKAVHSIRISADTRVYISSSE